MPALIDDVVRQVLAQAETLSALDPSEAPARALSPGEEPRS
jgi:hypothetical protein